MVEDGVVAWRWMLVLYVLDIGKTTRRNAPREKSRKDAVTSCGDTGKRDYIEIRENHRNLSPSIHLTVTGWPFVSGESRATDLCLVSTAVTGTKETSLKKQEK